MSLDDLFMPPIYIDGTRIRTERRLGLWPWEEPKPPKLTNAQKKARYFARVGRDEINRRERERRAAKRKPV